MGSKSKIEWTDSTWNPVRGCSRASEGCRHCYAEVIAGRFSGPGKPFEGLVKKTSAGFRWTGKVLPVIDHLADPLKWGTARKVFVNSVSDLFHDNVPVGYIRTVAGVMVAANWHTYQVLTKRSRRMAELLESDIRFAAAQPHIMWGVTVENRSTLFRIDDLRGTPAKLRYVSFEPLLEDVGEIDLSGIDWIIVGGESGHGARPFQKEWVQSLRDQAAAAGAAFFFKQWGGLRPKAAGCALDGLEYKEYPIIRTRPALPATERRRMVSALNKTAINPVL